MNDLLLKNGSPFVVVSSPGMQKMAEAALARLEKQRGIRFPHYNVEYTQFANGEVIARIPETVRRQHVFFFHPLQHPDPNTAIMMMLLANDAMKRASVSGITLVTPYIPYLRQDRKDKPRVPISARMLADLIESNGKVERIITADMHADQEQGFFSIPVDNLTSMLLFAAYFNARFQDNPDLVVVAPDFGGAVRARRFAAKLGNAPVAIFEKRRPSANCSEVVSLVGEPVNEKTVIIYDDMVDTGGTIRSVVAALKTPEVGAREVYICATHGIFSGGAEAKFAQAGFPVLTTNSIPRDDDYAARNPWLTIVPMDELLADAIYEASLVGGSISKLAY